MRYLIAVLGLALLATGGCSPQPESVWVEEPWILEPPGGTTSMAGYGVLHNPTDQAVVVAGVDSPAFERIQLHETRVENGQARMSAVDSLTLPAGGRAVMHPGGLHLMLMAPETALRAGDQAEIRFRLADGGALKVTFPVRKGSPQ